MNTSETNCNLKLPNGTLVNNISVQVPFDKPIIFPNKRSNVPFPPIVQAYFEGDTLQVSAVVLIDAAAEIGKNISVYFDSSQNGPIFYVTYNAPESEASEFTVYQVDFTVNLENKPQTIETIVWDEDPVNSRGTTTSVQP